MKGVVKGLIIGGVIAAVGIVIVIIALAVNGWSFKKIEFEMQTYTAEYNADSVKIEIGAGSVKTEFYDGDKVIIEYPTADRYRSEITDTAANLSYKAKPKWLISFGDIDIPDTIVKLPAGGVFNIEFDIGAGSSTIADGAYGNLDIDIGAGSFNATQIKCAEIKCDVGAGQAAISDVECNVLDFEVGAGRIVAGKATCSSAKIDVGAGEASVGFAGLKEEYTIATDIGAGRCNVSSQNGTSGKHIDIDVGAGSAKIDFVN